MKRLHILLTIAAAACLAVGCQRGLKFTVTSDIESAKFPPCTAVILSSEQLAQPVEVEVKDGAFVIQGKVEKPAYATLVPNSNDRKGTRALILEKGTITFQEGKAVGTPLNDAIVDFTRQLKDVFAQHPSGSPELIAAVDQTYLDFVTLHKDDPCAVFAIMHANRRISPQTQEKLIAAVSPEIRNQGEVRMASFRLKSQAK